MKGNGRVGRLACYIRSNGGHNPTKEGMKALKRAEDVDGAGEMSGSVCFRQSGGRERH